jgi:hypothetical protein
MRHLGQMNSVIPELTARTPRHPAQRTWTGAPAGEGDKPPAIGGESTRGFPRRKVGGGGGGGFLPRSREQGRNRNSTASVLGDFGLSALKNSAMFVGARRIHQGLLVPNVIGAPKINVFQMRFENLEY